ncbi:Cysteine-rich receptor-like protein, partial [Drosera capensis]
DQEKRKQLDWRRRYKIIEGIGRGLLYLHEDSRHRIVHRDLKAANILLDVNMIPKISDFGTARLVHIDKSCIETLQIAGTFGYMAPEYVLEGQISVKSDVYSFGVLTLEIISGSRRVRSSSDQSDMPQDLLNDAWNCWSDGEELKFMDESLASSYYSSIEVMKCIQLGLLCVQPNPEKRPTMASVVSMLNNISTLSNITTIILPEPQQPICFNTLIAESSSNSSAKCATSHSSDVTNP